MIVEGEAEFYALPSMHKRRLIKDCPPLKPINLNGVGSDRSLAGVTSLIVPKIIQHQIAGLRRVVVCIDREQRPICAGEFATRLSTELSSELLKRGRPSEGLSVVVADRTFEAWILADAEDFWSRGIFKEKPKFHRFEGSMGERNRKGTVELSRLLGREYSKKVDGPYLFRELSFARARTHGSTASGSRSLDKLLRVLGL